MLLFYFDNFVMRGKLEEDNSLDIITNLDVNAFQFFFKNFSNDGKLTNKTKYFENLKKSMIEHIVKIEDPPDIIRRAVGAEWDLYDFLGSF